MQTVKVSPRYEKQVKKYRLTPKNIREMREKIKKHANAQRRKRS